MIAFSLSSCQKEQIDQIDLSLPTTLAIEKSNPETEPRYDCEYQIISTSTDTPPQPEEDFHYILNTSINNDSDICGGGCPFIAYVEGCKPAPISNECLVENPAGTLKPTAWYPFNCQQVYFSDFDVEVNGATLFDNDDIGCANNLNFVSGTVGVRVRCKLNQKHDGCSQDWQETQTFSVPFDLGFSNPNDIPTINLGGCGCTPSVSYSM